MVNFTTATTDTITMHSGKTLGRSLNLLSPTTFKVEPCLPLFTLKHSRQF